MTTAHLPAERYLARLEAALSKLPEPERAEIVGEIRDHLSDAAASGRDFAGVLARLGPADQLARAYVMEHTLHTPRDGWGRVDRALTIIGLLAVASLPSFIVCVVLGAVGVALSTAGLGVLAAGVVELVRPGTMPDLTVSPWLLLVAGPALAACGVATLSGLYAYVRSLMRLVMRTLARVRAA